MILVCDACLTLKYKNQPQLINRGLAVCSCCKTAQDCSQFAAKRLQLLPIVKRIKIVPIAVKFNIRRYKAIQA